MINQLAADLLSMIQNVLDFVVYHKDFFVSAGEFIKWIVTTVSVGVGAYAVWRGVEAWRQKLHGTNEYAVCTDTLRAAWALYVAVTSLQRIELLDLELSEYSSKNTEDKTSPERYYNLKAQATSARLDRVNKAQIKLARVIPDLSAVIDPIITRHAASLMRISGGMIDIQKQIEERLRNGPDSDTPQGLKDFEGQLDALFGLLIGQGGERTIEEFSLVIWALEYELLRYMPPKRRKKIRQHLNTPMATATPTKKQAEEPEKE